MRVVEVGPVAPDVSIWRGLAAASDPEAGAVAITVRPDIRRAGWLGVDLLAALGVRRDVSGVGRNADADWALVPAWFRAWPVRELAVLRSDLLRPGLLEPLLLLAAQLDLTMWLVDGGGIDDAHARFREAWVGSRASADTFRAHWRAVRPKAHARAREEDSPFPVVPDADFPLFRAAARHGLDPDDFARVDALFLSCLEDALGWARSASPTVGGCKDRLGGLLRPMGSLARMTVAVRAHQVALFREGWLLRVDVPGLLASTDLADRDTGPRAGAWRALRAYREPWRGTVCALAAAGLSIDAICGLTVADAAPDGSSVTVDGPVVPLEPEAALFLRAQRELRLDELANDGDQLIGWEEGDRGWRAVVTALNAAARELDATFVGRHVTRRDPTLRRWTSGHWFALERLD